VARRGADTASAMVEGQPAGTVSYLRDDDLPGIERVLRATGLVDGVAPAIMEPVAVQDLRSRRTEARVGLFASDPANSATWVQPRDWASARTTSGRMRYTAPLSAWYGLVLVNRRGAASLTVRIGTA